MVVNEVQACDLAPGAVEGDVILTGGAGRNVRPLPWLGSSVRQSTDCVSQASATTVVRRGRCRSEAPPDCRKAL